MRQAVSGELYEGSGERGAGVVRTAGLASKRNAGRIKSGGERAIYPFPSTSARIKLQRSGAEAQIVDEDRASNTID